MEGEILELDGFREGIELWGFCEFVFSLEGWGAYRLFEVCDLARALSNVIGEQSAPSSESPSLASKSSVSFSLSFYSSYKTMLFMTAVPKLYVSRFYGFLVFIFH